MSKNNKMSNCQKFICFFIVLCIVSLLGGHIYLDKTPGYRWNILKANTMGLFKLSMLNEEITGTLAEHEIFEVFFDHFESINEIVVVTQDGRSKNVILSGIRNKMPKEITLEQLNSLYGQGYQMYFVSSDSKSTNGKYIGYLFDTYPKRLEKDANDSINARMFYEFGAKTKDTPDNILEIFFKKW